MSPDRRVDPGWSPADADLIIRGVFKAGLALHVALEAVGSPSVATEVQTVFEALDDLVARASAAALGQRAALSAGAQAPSQPPACRSGVIMTTTGSAALP